MRLLFDYFVLATFLLIGYGALAVLLSNLVEGSSDQKCESTTEYSAQAPTPKGTPPAIPRGLGNLAPGAYLDSVPIEGQGTNALHPTEPNPRT